MRHDNVRGVPAEEFSAWYRTLWPPVLRAVTVTVGDHDLAEEAVAEAFARALARWPRPTEFDSPVAWLHRSPSMKSGPDGGATGSSVAYWSAWRPSRQRRSIRSNPAMTPCGLPWRLFRIGRGR